MTEFTGACTKCSARFSTAWELTEHYRDVHGLFDRPEDALRKWSLARADEIIANEFTDDERDQVRTRGRALVRACMAVGILSEHLRNKTELEELRYLQSEVEQGDKLVRRAERERCAVAAKDAALTLRGWPVEEYQADEIAKAILELGD